MAGVELHESNEVLYGDRSKHRRLHWLATKRQLTTGSLVAIVRDLQAGAALGGRRRSVQRVHRLRGPALGERASLENLPEDDPEHRMDDRRQPGKRGPLTASHLDRCIGRSGNVLYDLAR